MCRKPEAIARPAVLPSSEPGKAAGRNPEGQIVHGYKALSIRKTGTHLARARFWPDGSFCARQRILRPLKSYIDQ